MSRVNVLIVGAGPAGLATAIRLKKKLNREKRSESVVVIDKAPKAGYHSLSGAVFEAQCLDELVPGWREPRNLSVLSMVKIERDDLYYLSPRRAFKFPEWIVPKPMRHRGDYAISLGRMVDWLTQIAREEGVEIHSGFAASRMIMEGDVVKGVTLVDLGLDKEGKPKSNFLSGEAVEANVTVLADGSRGVLSGQLIERVGTGKNPQVYSLGIKQLVKLSKDNAFGNNRSLHTLGFPSRPSVFGGGFLYSMGGGVVAVGLILGLDWEYQDLNPQQEFEIFKNHPFVSQLLKGGQVLAAGVKTIPEGGYYALPRLYTNGAVIVGDAAGFVNVEKTKGLHYAIRSGMSAADAIYEAVVKKDFFKTTLVAYQKNLEEREILRELYHARNFRQAFRLGLYLGAPLSRVQAWFPFRLGMKKDYLATKSGSKLNRKSTEALDKAQFVSLSGAVHREDEPPHIKILNAELCKECTVRYANPCVYFCPGKVYRMKGGELILSPSNCMHDGSCAVKCPYQNILWTCPEGGEGPRFKQM
jgi:electron-transferring-flavoprotein dehydrogenase